MQLSKIIKYLDKKFPSRKAEPWDKVGLQQFGRSSIDLNQDINHILTVLDLNVACFTHIQKTKPDLIITRHPFIFRELSREKHSAAKKQMIKWFLKHKTLVYSIHTNYDYYAIDAFTALLVPNLEIKSVITSIASRDYLMVKLKSQITMHQLINNLQQSFANADVCLSDNIDLNGTVKQFYLNQGAGSEMISQHKLHDCVFVTGEAKWSDWIYCNDNNVQLITIGHYMENYFIVDLAKRLQHNFTNLHVATFDIKPQYKRIKE